MRDIRHIWFIALKDLKIFVRDRASLFFFIVFPFLFIILFNFLLKGVGSEDRRLELHLATREGAGGLSQMILAGMETKDESLLAPGAPKIVWEKDYAAARLAVEEGRLGGFIAFPEDFTPALLSGKPAALEVFADATNANMRTALNGLARALAAELGANQVVIRASISLLAQGGIIPTDAEAIGKAAQEMMARAIAEAGQSSLSFRVEKVGEVKEVNPSNYVVPGYLVMFVFFAAAVSAEMVVRERQNHTLERLLATSVRKSSILGGIFLGSVIKGLLQITIFWVVGVLAFHVDMGRAPLAVVILSVLMVLLSSAFAVMLATLVRTQRSAGSLAVITSLVLAPLGGCWWPSFLYPLWLQNIARIAPHTWATSGFNKLMLFGAGFGSVVPEMLALVAFGIIFGVIAVWRFRTSAL